MGDLVGYYTKGQKCYLAHYCFNPLYFACWLLTTGDWSQCVLCSLIIDYMWLKPMCIVRVDYWLQVIEMPNIPIINVSINVSYFLCRADHRQDWYAYFKMHFAPEINAVSSPAYL